MLEKLKQIEAARPEEVVKEVQNIIKQEAENVKGDVYQAGGDINIGVEQTNPFLKWYYGVALLAAILTIVKISTDLINTDQENGADPNQIVEQQVLAGTIWDDRGEPLEDVNVFLSDFDATTLTDDNGKFRFVIRDARKERLVDLVARRDGFSTVEKEASLGNASFNFKLRRKP